MKKHFKFILLTILIFLPVLILSSDNIRKPLTIDDYFEIKSVGDPQISPDGKWVAFTLRTYDLKMDKTETGLWMIPASGGESIPMTAKGYSASLPRWSPDGKYLSFLAAKNEEDKPQVWTLNRLGGEARQITKIKQGVSGYEWSPDGKRLLLMLKDPRPEELTKDKADDKKPKPHVIDRLQFKMDNEGYLDRFRTHLYICNPGDSIATQITSGDYDDAQPVWHPNGKSIAFVSNRTTTPDGNTNMDIWIVSADNTDKGQTLLQITKNPGSDTSPVWSPDGKHLAYITVTDLEAMWYATNHLAIQAVNGDKPRLLTEKLDRNISQPRFSPDGKSIWFVLEDSGESQLASIGISGKDFKRKVAGKLSVSAYDVHGSVITPLISKFTVPAEIYTYQKDRLTQLTTVNDPIFDKVITADVNNIHFKSQDGTEIEGFLVLPIGYNPSMNYPTILWNHGGPVSQYEFGFRFTPNLFAAHGYAVLMINPRGSSGYGQAFSKAIFADWGNKDFQDVMAGVDYAIGKGYSDPDRLGVGGWSYGGILTNYVITQTDRFKGAVSGASEALYRANYGHDHYQLDWELELGLPWENPEKWESLSPFNKVDKITTPTLWIGGAADWNVPILNSEQMYQSMKRLGRETQLVVYPGEHHGIRRPSFQKDRFERYLTWFDKYVKNNGKSSVEP